MRSTLLHPSDNTSPQLPKLKCAFHKDEYLTNFCSSKQCLLPLCPSCIKIHISQHIKLKTNPQLENVNDSIRQLHEQLACYSQKFNSIYKQLVEVESGVEQFRQSLRMKVHNAKYELIATIQDHFRRIQLASMQKVNELRYIKNLSKYKDLAKKTILALKNSQRSFFSEENKVMRMVIKFESNGLKEQLEKFCRDSKDFAALKASEYLSFSLKDNTSFKQIQNIQNFFNIQLDEPGYSHEPKDLLPLIKELYEKPTQKKEVKRSVCKFISNRDTPAKGLKDLQKTSNYDSIEPLPLKDFPSVANSHKNISVSHGLDHNQSVAQDYQFVMPNLHENNKETIVYNSVKESISKATKDFNHSIYKNSRLDQSIDASRGKRRSVSRSRGITLTNSTIESKPVARPICTNFLKSDINLNLINSKTEYVPRKFR